MTPVLLADDELFLGHVAPTEHPERGERILAVRQGLRFAASGFGLVGRRGPASASASASASGSAAGLVGRRGPDPASASGSAAGLVGPPASSSISDLSDEGGAYVRLEARDASDDELARVHEPKYVEALGHLAGRSGYLDSDTYLSPGSVAAARRAAGATVGLVDGLCDGAARFGFAVTRPPGHHALPDRAMGFCLLNNVAVAAAHARARGHARVLVLDWDVHHGNGTEAIFYDDPSVLFISLHQFPNYPGTGAATDLGTGAGRGSNVNLPLPKAGNDGVYAAAFERVVLPIVQQFAPTFVLVSCGFDAHERDPLAEMSLSAGGYAWMTERLIGALDQACPLGVVLEGGYDLEALSASSQAVAEVLLGSASTAPFSRTLSEAHAAALAQIERAQAPFWKLA